MDCRGGYGIRPYDQNGKKHVIPAERSDWRNLLTFEGAKILRLAALAQDDRAGRETRPLRGMIGVRDRRAIPYKGDGRSAKGGRILYK